MDAKNSSTPSLSALVQTRSLELVIAPIAKHVAQLLALSNERGRSFPFPDLMPSTLAIMEAVQDLANVAQKIATESLDEKLKKDLPKASEIVLKAGEQLLEAAGRLSDNPLSQHAKSMLCSASHTLLEGTMKVLLVWDNGEIQKIIKAAEWVLDRLGLVQGGRSMRGLVICFGGFSESMLLLLRLADKRQMELTNPKSKQQLLSALERLKITLPLFSSTMQAYVKSPTSISAKEAKDSFANELSSAIYELIDAVRPLDQEADNMAGNIIEVQRKLTTSSRFFIDPDLDRHLNAIIQNSMAVAHVSRDQYREAIQRLSGEVLSLRKELQDQAEAIYIDPDDTDAKKAFDSTADHLCERLLELDRWVADSVVDQVTEAFVETSVPIDHLVQAATSATGGLHNTSSTTTVTPASTTSPNSSECSSHHDDSLKGLTKQVDLFRRHSRRLSQVAAYAAQSSTNAERVQVIKVLADNIDHLTPRVVEAAMKVKKEPVNKHAREQLDSVRREWAGKVQQLTGAIDNIIDPEDFMAVSEANIQQDMAKCRDAIQSKRWAELSEIVQGIAAKARRVLEVGQTAVKNAADRDYKNNLTKAVHRLERGIPQMPAYCQHVISNPSSQRAQDQFVLSLRQLLEGIHDIQSVLSSGIDVPQQDASEEEVFDPKGSSQVSSAQAQERMLKRNIERQKKQPRFIGNLAAASIQKANSPDSPHFVNSREYGTQTGTSQHPVSVSADVETQIPHPQTRDQALQVDMPTSDSSGTFSPEFSVSTASWKTPLSPDLTSSHPSTPFRVARRAPDENKTMRSYVSPLQKLVTAAKSGDPDGISSHATQLSARTIRLTTLAESAAKTLKPNTELSRSLQKKASQVKKMVPRIIDNAKKVASSPRQDQSLDDLQISSHQWAGHVRQLVEATQQASLPWSKTAENLVAAAKKGEDVEKQITHMSTQTNRMVDIATMTIEAAKTEEAIGSADDSDVSQDKELQEQVRHVRVTASEIQKLTPRLLSAAQEASIQQESLATIEHLNILSQEWATKAKVLMKGVDDVSLGMGGAADTLLLSAKSGDPVLLTEQTEAIQTLADSMDAIAKYAIEGCTNSDKVQVVKTAASAIKKLSTQLIDCANALSEIDHDEEESDEDQDNQETSELLRRDWSSQIHLLTAHIDDLTAEVSAPLDRLVDIALQASRTDRHVKQHLLKQFENEASFINDQLEEVKQQLKKVIDSRQVKELPLENVEMSLSFLRKLTPHAIGAARSLATDPGSAMLDHFNHLRRQWASRAQFLLANLKQVTSADMELVIAAFMDLMHSSGEKGQEYPRQRSFSSEDIPEEKLDLYEQQPSTSMNRVLVRSREDVHGTGLRPTPQRTKRPVSMAVPLPSWVNKEDKSDPYSVSSQSIAVAAQSLREVTDVFEDNNPIVEVAKKMSTQMSQMAEFTRGQGELQSKTDMILTAKAIAANGQVIARFANIISDNCTDKTIKSNLQYCVEMIPTLSTQLRIIASVKAVTPDDTSAEVMLVKNAQNLMKAVIKTVQAAEAACMKGLKPPDNDDEEAEQIETTETTELARGWKHKLYRQRTLETIQAPLDARGMRKLNKNRISTPSVLDVIKPRQSLLISPPRKSVI